jgi:hypothetical protein
MSETDYPVAIITVKAMFVLPQEPHVSMRVLGNGIYFTQWFAIRAFNQVKFELIVLGCSML